mgnify:CR=1 FL=1
MKLHESTFEYLKPTDEQVADMAYVRSEFRQLIENISTKVPDGPDKTYLIRKIREAAMWANVAITRQADGSPRT